jgi:Family of unknown function (DUF5329)
MRVSWIRSSGAMNFFHVSGSHSAYETTLAIMLLSALGANRPSRRPGGIFVALLSALVIQTALAASAPAVAPLSDAEKIEALIRAVEARKELQFIRLDVAHSAGEAAGLLRIKLAFAGSRVKTVGEFIDYVATASSTTGKPYFVRYPDGREVTSAEFLRQELKRIESASAAVDPADR